MSAAGALALHAGLACAQNYPQKVVRFVTAAPGSANDYVARLIAQDLSRALGQQVIVENRASLAPEVVAKSPADGYTILLNGSSTWLLPLMRRENYDPLEDLTPVTMAVTSPNILVVHPSMP
ncbi:MAG: tripartite tricarboxylate transporter substrate binding protein, partial [Betaproteobacteria bacterium]|nr:tripartite tricarboxylate transporter substrate binding protein [Betaproteobacteria bacterium]